MSESFGTKMFRNFGALVFFIIAYLVCTIGFMSGGFFLGIKKNPGFKNTFIDYSNKDRYEVQRILDKQVMVVIFGIGRGGVIFFKAP